MLKALTRLVLGVELQGPHLAVLAVTFTNFIPFMALSTYGGLWLIEDRGVAITPVTSALFLAGGIGVIAAVLGGSITDRWGPRKVLTTVAGLQVTAAGLLCLPLRTSVATAFLVLAIGSQPARGIAQRLALVRAADAADTDRAFAGLRLAMGLGSLLGPFAGAMLVAWGWMPLRIGLFALYGLSLLSLLALRKSFPDRGSPVPADGGPTRASRAFLLVLAGSVLGWMLVYLYESVLPILAVRSDWMSPGQWGLYYAVGPLIMLVAQMRVHEAVRGLPARLRLGAGLLLMGGSFLAVLLPISPAVILLLILVFVGGDMLWGPACEHAIAQLAPAARNGVYVGLGTSTIWVGNALAPAVGLPLTERFGARALTATSAVITLLGLALYLRARVTPTNLS